MLPTSDWFQFGYGNMLSCRVTPCINLLHVGTESTQLNIVDSMDADGLAPCVARKSAPMILTMQNR